MAASQFHAIARIERDLTGNALHQPVHPAVVNRVILGLVGEADLELVLDRSLRLDRLHAIEFGLLATFGIGRIFIAGLTC